VATPTVCTVGGAGKPARARLQVRSWLTGLLRISLCQGSLQDGIYQHDIVRDYAISRCGNLPDRQLQIVEAIVDESLRPTSGWPEAHLSSGHGSLEWYVATYAAAHISSAMLSNRFGEVLREIVVSDFCIKESCAMALGRAGIEQWADTAEKDGRFLEAARILICGTAPAKEGGARVAVAVPRRALVSRSRRPRRKPACVAAFRSHDLWAMATVITLPCPHTLRPALGTAITQC
jgi:hypothetical protein